MASILAVLTNYLSSYLTNVTAAVVSYTLLALGMSWLLGEFRHKAFDRSMYWTEYRESVKVMIITGLGGTLVNAVIPSALYSGPLTHGLGYLIKSVIVYTLLFDGFNYWTHRIFHTPWMYRNIHNFHHKFRPVMTMGAAALHPADSTFSGQLSFWLPLAFLTYFGHGMWNVGFHGSIMWISIYSLYLHSVIGHRMGGIMMDNSDHLIHHSLTTYNYSNLFRFWDVVCGTYRADAPIRKGPGWTSEETTPGESMPPT